MFDELRRTLNAHNNMEQFKENMNGESAIPQTVKDQILKTEEPVDGKDINVSEEEEKAMDKLLKKIPETDIGTLNSDDLKDLSESYIPDDDEIEKIISEVL